MKFLELSAKLKEKVENMYLVVGQDAYLRQTAIRLIKKSAVSNITESFDLSVFNNENFDLNRIYEATSSLPFGDGKKLVIIKEIAKLNENDKSFFENIVKNLPSSTCLVLDMSENVNNFKFGELVDCSFLDNVTLTKYIMVECQKNNITIQKNAADMLIEFKNHNLTEIISELPKLFAYLDYNGEIRTDIIKKLVSPNLEYNVFELTESLGNKNKEKSINLLNLMLKNNEMGILPLISNHFRRIIFTGLSDYSDLELAEMFKVKPFAITKARAQSKLFTKVQLKNILELLDSVDFMIKSGKMQNENALFYTMFKILEI